MLLGVEVRADDQLRRRGAIQQENQPQALEARHILQSLGELWKDFHGALSAACRRGLNRRAVRMKKGRMDYADGGHRWKSGAGLKLFVVHEPSYQRQRSCIEYR